MSKSRSVRLQDHFGSLTDPRRRPVVYPLINIVAIAICAVVAGADDFVSIADYGRKKWKWLGQFLDLSSGIPSHDRFNAVLGAIKPAEFEKCLLSWLTALQDVTDGQVVAIDGKTLRGSYDKASSKSAIHMVSAWATANQLSLGQLVVGEHGDTALFTAKKPSSPVGRADKDPRIHNTFPISASRSPKSAGKVQCPHPWVSRGKCDLRSRQTAQVAISGWHHPALKMQANRPNCESSGWHFGALFRQSQMPKIPFVSSGHPAPLPGHSPLPT